MNDAPTPTRSGSRRGNLMIAAVATVIVLALIAIGIYAWQSLGASALTTQGYIALVLGVIATAGLGVGLMVLVFYSNRYGYDERVGSGDEPPERR